jgi:hypothetical protein
VNGSSIRTTQREYGTSETPLLDAAFRLNFEHRAQGKDGQYRRFLVRHNPFCEEQGRLVRWYATGTDIDDLKRAEDRTRNENVALREDIVRSSMFEGGNHRLV